MDSVRLPNHKELFEAQDIFAQQANQTNLRVFQQPIQTTTTQLKLKYDLHLCRLL